MDAGVNFTVWMPFSINGVFFKKAVNAIDIVATEAYSTLRYIIPASLTWLWRKYISKQINTITIQVTLEEVAKIAYLNIHRQCTQIKR